MSPIVLRPLIRFFAGTFDDECVGVLNLSLDIVPVCEVLLTEYLQTAAEGGQRFSTESLLDTEFSVGSASTRTTGNGRGRGSTQYRGRGQQAEAATLVAILDDAAAWLNDEPK